MKGLFGAGRGQLHGIVARVLSLVADRPTLDDSGNVAHFGQWIAIMRYRLVSLILVSSFLAACNTTSTSPDRSPPGQDTPAEARGIVGEWNFKATDSVLSCRVKVSGQNSDREGNATDFGCIGLDDFFMIRRWKRERGTIEFYRLADDKPVASLYRVSRDEFRGELLPSGREAVLTRR